MIIQPYKAPLPDHLNGHVAQDTLTQDEYEAFKVALPCWRDRLITMLLRNTGLRINELLRLQVRDFVLEGPAFIIYVIRSKKAEKTEYEAAMGHIRSRFLRWVNRVGPPLGRPLALTNR